MEFMKFFGLVIIATIIYTPIDKKYNLRSKYHNYLNKRFRIFMGIVGLFSIVMVSLIAFLSDDYLQSIGVNRNFISFVFLIPGLFFLMVATPLGKDE